MSNNNPKGVIAIVLVIAAIVAIEFGLVSGGVYDILRIVLIVLFALVTIAVIAVVAYLIYAGNKQQEPNERQTPSITVRSSSDMEARGTRYWQQDTATHPLVAIEPINDNVSSVTFENNLEDTARNMSDMSRDSEVVEALESTSNAENTIRDTVEDIPLYKEHPAEGVSS